ncbi:MAG: sulfite exporter TauE/SafE family protein [Bradymonadia bacterium]
MIDLGLVLGGFLAGVINALAGGGSTITLPLLLLFGVDAGVANGTNRIAVLCQSVSATRSFAANDSIDWSVTWRLLPIVLGSAMVGSHFATQIPVAQLESVFGWMFILLGSLFLFKSKISLGRSRVMLVRFRVVLLMGVGFYGGLLQAGVGIPLLMTLLSLYGMDFGKANGTKSVHIAIYSLAVLFVFGSADQVHLRFGAELGLGGILGSHVGAKIAMRHQPQWLTPVLSCFLFVMGVKSLL